MKERIQLITGYLFLFPGLFGTLVFIIDMLWLIKQHATVEKVEYKTLLAYFSANVWNGTAWGETGGYSPMLPLYFGLMAIAGAYLIANTSTNPKKVK